MFQLTEKEMIRAMTQNDKSYNGRFYVGVISTGIYCLPSCPARLPLLKNIKFYESREEALSAGLRGCKRCKSETFPDILPEWLKPLLVFMKEILDRKIDETELMRVTGVDISTIRRHFKSHLNTTPAAFHRRQRLLYAKSLVESGADYLGAAFDIGFESASGFRTAFVKEFGFPPGRCNARL